MDTSANGLLRIPGPLLVAAFALASSASWHIDAGDFIRVDMQIETQSFGKRDGEGTPARPKRAFPATCVISLTSFDKWRIVSSFALNGTDVFYFDGENVIRTITITGPPPPRSRNAVPTRAFVSTAIARSSPLKNVYITKGSHPMGKLGVNIIWLAYCSGDYLKANGRLLPIPGFSVRETVRAFACEDKCLVFEDALGLPRKISFYVKRAALNDPLVHKQLYRTENNAPERFQHLLPSGEKDGLLRAQYAVHSSTNWFGNIVPTGFSYVQYGSGADTRWRKQLEVTGHVLAINSADEPPPLLEEGKSQHVTDMRFRHPTQRVDSISYVNTNSVLPRTNDAVLLALYDQKVAARPVDKLRSRPMLLGTRWLFVSLLLLLLIAPAVVLVMSKVRRRERKP